MYICQHKVTFGLDAKIGAGGNSLMSGSSSVAGGNLLMSGSPCVAGGNLWFSGSPCVVGGSSLMLGSCINIEVQCTCSQKI